MRKINLLVMHFVLVVIKRAPLCGTFHGGSKAISCTKMCTTCVQTLRHGMFQRALRQWPGASRQFLIASVKEISYLQVELYSVAFLPPLQYCLCTRLHKCVDKCRERERGGAYMYFC